MAILSSKTIDLLDGQNLSDTINRVRFFLLQKDLSGKKLTITIEDDQPRQKKYAAKAELERLAVDAALENMDTWVYQDYKFFFVAAKYYWKGQEVHITANEGLFLFHLLVSKDIDYVGRRWYYLRNIRRRLGDEFLKGSEHD